METQEFGRYRLQSLIGAGGMGQVYQALDTKHDRVVALKLLLEVFSTDGEYQRRFRRESHAVARLREPHIIPIHNYGEINQRLFIDMRLVDGGRNIGTILADQGPFTPARAVRLISQVADALDAAHADGIVHRDVKPSNVLVTPSEFVYVVDFGIAQAVGRTVTSLTTTGTTVGTLDYMAPERFDSRTIDYRTDVYSLACLLYECLTAARPFTGTDLPSLMFAHLHTPPPKPSQANLTVPVEFDAITARGMAKKPEERFASAGQLAEAARAALAAVVENPTSLAPITHRVDDRLIRSPLGEEITLMSDTSAAAQRPTHREPLNGSNGHLQQPKNDSNAVDETIIVNAASTPQPPEQLPVTPPSPPIPSNIGDIRAPSAVNRRLQSIFGFVGIGVAILAAVIIATVLTDHTLLNSVFPHEVVPPSVASPAAPHDHSDDPAISPSIAVPAVGPSVGVGPTPSYVEVAPSGRFAYIANRDAGIITVLDTTINNVTATIPMPAGSPQFIAFTPDGKHAYVSIYNNARTVNVVAVLDTATNTVLTTIPVDKRPFALAVAPDQRSVWVPSHDTATIDVINVASATITHKIPVAPNPHWVTFSRDGRRVYVANHESNVLSVIDTTTFSVLTTIPVGTSPHSTALSPDGTRLSVVCYDSNNVFVIDTASNKVVATIPVGLKPQDITYAPDGRYAYTANVDGGTVSVIDTATNTVTATIPAGNSPTSVGVLPDGRQAYVTSLDSGKITILDIAR